MDCLAPEAHWKMPSPGKEVRGGRGEEGDYLPGVCWCHLCAEPRHPGGSEPRPGAGAAARSSDTHPSRGRWGGESRPGRGLRRVWIAQSLHKVQLIALASAEPERTPAFQLSSLDEESSHPKLPSWATEQSGRRPGNITPTFLCLEKGRNSLW